MGGGEKIFFSPSSSHRLYTPDARPLGTYETKMAALIGKRSILTILRKNTGQLTVKNTKYNNNNNNSICITEAAVF